MKKFFLGLALMTLPVGIFIGTEINGNYNFIGANTFAQINSVEYVDGVQNTTVAAAIAALPSTGGKVVVPCGTYTISSTITITNSSGPIVLEGCGMGNTTSGGTRLVASSGSVSPIIQIQGSTSSTRAGNIFIRDLTIQGVYTTTQVCMQIDHATYIVQNHVAYNSCGQAEWDDDVYRSVHDDVSYFLSGSGGTNTTAVVRVENTSNPSVASEQIFFLDCTWQGNLGSMQGTAVYFGPATQEERIIASKLDYFSADPGFPLIYINQANTIDISNNTISGYSATSPALGVVYVTGTSGTHANQVHINNNTTISFSNTVPAIYLDYVTNYEVLGGTFQGNGSGTAIVTTAHTFGGGIGPFRMDSADTPVNDASGLAGIIYSDPTTGQIDVRSPLNINQPQTNTSTISTSGGLTDTSAQTQIKRLRCNQGTAQANTNVSLSGSWGTSPSTSISGEDGCFAVTVNSGSGSPGASPSVSVTFADGAWPNGNPICIGNRADGDNSPVAAQWNIATTTTTLTATFAGTPAASTAYVAGIICQSR